MFPIGYNVLIEMKPCPSSIENVVLCAINSPDETMKVERQLNEVVSLRIVVCEICSRAV